MPVSVSQIPFVVSSTLSRLSVTALPAGSASAASETSTIIKVERRAGFAGEVALTVEGIPPGVNTTLDKIAADSNEVTFKLVASEKAPRGTNTLTVIGAGLHKDRNYKSRSGPIMLIIDAAEPSIPPASTAATAPPAVGSR
jgi:hypothetical protein